MRAESTAAVELAEWSAAVGDRVLLLVVAALQRPSKRYALIMAAGLTMGMTWDR